MKARLCLETICAPRQERLVIFAMVSMNTCVNDTTVFCKSCTRVMVFKLKLLPIPHSAFSIQIAVPDASPSQARDEE
jgi:hypothetical protein